MPSPISDFWEGDLHFSVLSGKNYYAVQQRCGEHVCWVGSVRQNKSYGVAASWAAVDRVGREIGAYPDRTRAAQALTFEDADDE